MLEYGVAIIITPIKRFHDHLCSVGSEEERRSESQQNNDYHAEVANGTDYYQEIRFGRETTGNVVADFAKELKAIKQEMTEMKITMETCAISEEIKSTKTDMKEMKDRMDRYATVILQMKEILLDG